MLKIKNKTKMLMCLGLILIIVCLLNINKVYAAEVSEEYLDNLITKIPSSMELDIQEIEYEKAHDLVLNNIKKVLNDNSISYSDSKHYDISNIKLNDITLNGQEVTINVDLLSPYADTETLKKISVTVDPLSYGSSRDLKWIQLSYNNTKNYNKDDEAYIKSINLKSPKYYEVDLDFLSNGNLSKASQEMFKMIETYYQKQLNDSSITIKANAGAGGTEGGLNLWTFHSGTYIAIFKNGILYDVKDVGEEFTMPVIKVPNTIKNEELSQYVISLINEKYKDMFSENNETITEIKAGNDLNLDIQNCYTVYIKNAGMNSYVIIEKETSPVIEEEKTTGIKFEANTDVVPENTKLVVNEIVNGEVYNTVKTILKDTVGNMKIFDISLESDNVKIQPNGKVKISIPIPDNFDTSKLVVYRISDTGNKTKYNVLIENNYATFETNHFSTYVLAEEQENVTTETKKGEKDNTPKTGISTNMYMYIAILTIIGIGITKIIIKENKKC